ncbi:MAG: fatty acyl-AMP ligase [Methylobacteriaceae bacterium]|nr:fatty acyl-AMP ligase [Methylobacteriaceae bacterium]
MTRHVLQTSYSGTLADRLDMWVGLQPEKPALVYLDDGECETDRWSFAALRREARKVAGLLRTIGAAGRPVLLVFPPGLAFVAALYGCLNAGAIAVPVPSLGGKRGSTRLAAIAQDARPVAALTTAAMIARGAMKHVDALRAVSVIATDGLEDPVDFERHAVAPDSVALLQYTSGSTSEPKGVAVTHSALMANLEMLRAAQQVDHNSVYVSWLPLFHDMGLLGVVLEALFAGAMTVLMPPLAFLQRPARWLAAIDRYRATISGGPNFAFDLCARRHNPDTWPRFDLSSWQVAFCAAEPVRAETLHRFAATFSAHGFRAAALYPAYGLAEASVFVSGGEVGAGVKTMLPLEQAHVAEAAPGLERRVVSCGRGWHDETILIVDPDSRRERCEGETGEIWISGRNVAAGYWNRPAATLETFGARLPDRQGRAFLRTGDLGFVSDGELYVVGRMKDLLIVNGTSLHPQDVEDAIAASHPAFAARGAAFGIDHDRGEQVVAAHEIARSALSEDLSPALAAAFAAVGHETGVRLFDLVLVRPGGIPLTTSGKVRRSKCRELYTSDRLPIVTPTSDHPWLGKYRQ